MTDKVIDSVIGRVFKDSQFWKVKCRYVDGSEGFVAAHRKNSLRNMLISRGLTADHADDLISRADV